MLKIDLKKKRNLFRLIGLSCLPAGAISIYLINFTDPYPSHRDFFGGASNGMHYWEHIKKDASNQNRPDFCLIQRTWSDSGPFPLTCYQPKKKTLEKKSYQVIKCSVPNKVFSFKKIEEEITLPCNLNWSEITFLELKELKGIDIGRYKRFYGDQQPLTIEKFGLFFRQIDIWLVLFGIFLYVVGAITILIISLEIIIWLARKTYKWIF